MVRERGIRANQKVLPLFVPAHGSSFCFCLQTNAINSLNSILALVLLPHFPNGVRPHGPHTHYTSFQPLSYHILLVGSNWVSTSNGPTLDFTKPVAILMGFSCSPFTIGFLVCHYMTTVITVWFWCIPFNFSPPPCAQKFQTSFLIYRI